MTIDEIKEKTPNCPGCRKECPIDELSCPKGEALVGMLESGELDIDELIIGEFEERRFGECRGEEKHEHHGFHGPREAFGPHGPHGPVKHGPYGCHGPERHPFRRPGEGFGPGKEFGPREGFGPGKEFGPGEGFGPHRPMMSPFPEDDDSLAGLIRRAAFGMHRPGMRRSQERVLRMLASGEQMSQRHLQELLRVKPGSMSELLGKLESKGFIERARSGEDKRRVSLKITDAGLDYLKSFSEESSDPFSALSEEEQETLKALLKKLIEA